MSKIQEIRATFVSRQVAIVVVARIAQMTSCLTSVWAFYFASNDSVRESVRTGDTASWSEI